jgi:glucose-6-phosphate isomerase
MSDAMLQLDTTFLFSNQAHTHLITTATQELTRSHVTSAVESVEKKLETGKYGFVEVLKDARYLSQTKQVLAQVQNRPTIKNLVVVGIGGSDLGARALYQALATEQSPLKVSFHGDSTDPVQLTTLLRQLELRETIFNIISKSGQTVETTVQYILLKQLCQQQGLKWQEHFVLTTDPEEGLLRAELQHEQILNLPIPPSVGGRFSVLTPVGLFPAAAMGVDVGALVTGALDFAQSLQLRQLAQQFAATQFQLAQQGTKVVVCMPYSVQLEEFARWFRQLWAESLGKDGKGILPIQARGPADQHSQSQFYHQGSPLQSVLLLRVEKRTQDFSLQQISDPELAYLNGHSLAEIINLELLATQLSLHKAGRPTAVLSVPEVSAYTMGQLIIFFELAVVYLAEMLGVNAFDQPGVEESKQMMYALLGRKGFEAKRLEIEKLSSNSAGSPG